MAGEFMKPRIEHYEGALEIVQKEYLKGNDGLTKEEYQNLFNTAVYFMQRIKEMKQGDTDA
jgi:hypothetical protein